MVFVCPIFLIYLINLLFFNQNEVSNKYLSWIILIVVSSVLIFGLFKIDYGVEGVILRGIIGLTFYVAFTVGVFKYYSFDKIIRNQIRLKFIITLIILLIIGFSFCSSEGMF